MELEKKKKLILTLIMLLILNSILGHFLPPYGILITPVLIALATGIIIFKANGFNFFFKLIISYLFIGLNDISLKLFAGGIHDTEGMGWIHTALLMGLVPSFIMILIGAYNDKISMNWIKFTSILLFILLIYFHLQIFGKLGI